MHIELNVQALRDHARRVGIDPDRFYCRELSRRLGVGEPTISKLLNGKAEPGNRFMATCLAHFGVANFHELFKIASDS
jgi:transcriptional regulator with XRE-family HTH domain